MSPILWKPEYGPFVEKFWGEVDAALEEIRWVPVPVPIPFAEVFERLLLDFDKGEGVTSSKYLERILGMSPEEARRLSEWCEGFGESMWGALKALNDQDFLALKQAMAEGALGSEKGLKLLRKKIENALALANTRLRYCLAREMIQVLKVAESERILDIGALVRQLNPTARSGAFLERVSRCFLFGCDLECMVMCRSALESEVEARISTDDCIEHLGHRTPARGRREALYEFADRIAVAQRLGKLNDEQASHAHDVRRKGNQAVHQMSARGKKEVLRMIERTIELLDALCDEPT